MAKFGSTIGSWSFLIGVILAVIFGLLGGINATMMWILIAAGIIVGLLNIGEQEISRFLISGATIIIVSAFGSAILSSVTMVGGILDALLVIFVPATIVVAIKHGFSMTRNK